MLQSAQYTHGRRLADSTGSSLEIKVGKFDRLAHNQYMSRPQSACATCHIFNRDPRCSWSCWHNVCLHRAKAFSISLLLEELIFSSQVVQYVKTGKLLNGLWLREARLYPLMCIIIPLGSGLAWLWPTAIKIKNQNHATGKLSSFCHCPSGRHLIPDNMGLLHKFLATGIIVTH